MEFEKLGIRQEILKSLIDLGFHDPTSVQRKTIPLVLEGKDVIVGSETGSGKTLAFGAGIIQNIERGKGVQALILTPTRELAEQVMDMLRSFSKYKPLKTTAIYGGVSISPQFKNLKDADIVVGTPGRLLDHLDRGTIDLSRVRHLVLDEADRMLDMGFFDDVNEIISNCPEKKQMLLFSATIPPEVEHLSKRFMRHPIKVRAGDYVDPGKLHQVYYDVRNNMKFSLLVHLMKQEKGGLVMVFCNSRISTDFVARGLKSSGIDAMSIHGGLTQSRRTSVLSKFHSKNVFVLVCTDVAARGLDIPNVSHVYNYDMPSDSKQYVHRIGRTARAGKSGKAINLISDRDHENFGRVQRDYSLDIKKAHRPGFEMVRLKTGFGQRNKRFSDRRPQRQGGQRRERPQQRRH